MKNLTLRIFEQYRVRLPGYDPHPEAGAFRMASPVDGEDLRIVATSGMDWDHVSVSRKDRCPDWTELEHVKRIFFWPYECAMQLHVPVADHINNNEFCLHIWRPQKVEIPRPPGILVGVAGMTQADIKPLGFGLF